MAALLTSLGPLVAALAADGYRVVGPTVRDGTITLAELASADELPYGWAVLPGPGSYRLVRRNDRAAFGYVAAPQSAKAYLHQARSLLWSAQRAAGGEAGDAEPALTQPSTEEPRYAMLGLRPCDVRAIGIQDRVLRGGRYPDRRYAARRARLFVVAVNCTEPAPTCFCASAGGGPAASAGFDLALTELVEPGTAPVYTVDAGSPAGSRLLDRLPHREAVPAEVAAARDAVAGAAGRMGRALPATDLRALLAGRLQSPRWDGVAQRCLSCGNCTLVCPTCFCTTVTDATDLTGDIAERWQSWASCFDLDYSYLHGGPVRGTIRSRYRQWLTHKLGTWHDQFGESGCVGCGRCIVWCPAGIDLTEEIAALAVVQAEQMATAGEAIT
jgi:ferredoxin